ncbi:hypothetical protein HK405_007871 [Cladochytrium tenue]|nr:hypothetical protein HK405_007871 [Cladochytrium tenue]
MHHDHEHEHHHHHHHDGVGHDLDDSASVTSFHAEVATYLEDQLGVPSAFAAILADRHVLGFLLSVTASLGTFLGGILVVALVRLLGTKPDSPAATVLIGRLQAFSAGVMLYMTFIDLLPDAAADIGHRQAMAWFFVGVAGFAALEWAVSGSEDHGHDGLAAGGHSHSHGHGHAHTHGEGDKKTQEQQPEGNSEAKADGDAAGPTDEMRRQLLRTGLITFYALMLHNLPGCFSPRATEGLGVYLSALSNIRLGLQLAVAILLHNVPEGMAVAIPLYAASSGASAGSGMSTGRILFLTLLNGLAEPAGVLVGAAILSPLGLLTQVNLSRCLAAVAGVMACISLHELQPTAAAYAGQVTATASLFVGMFTAFLALEAVAGTFGHAHGHGGGAASDGHSLAHGDHTDAGFCGAPPTYFVDDAAEAELASLATGIPSHHHDHHDHNDFHAHDHNHAHHDHGHDHGHGHDHDHSSDHVHAHSDHRLDEL